MLEERIAVIPCENAERIPSSSEACVTVRPVGIDRETGISQGDDIGKRTYTVEEIQGILKISRPTAYALVRRNVFRSIRIGGKIRVSKRSFDAWLDQGIL